MHLGEGQVWIFEGYMPILYQPTIRRMVKPVPAIFGRPPRTPVSRSMSVPISTHDAMASVYRDFPVIFAESRPAQTPASYFIALALASIFFASAAR